MNKRKFLTTSAALAVASLGASAAWAADKWPQRTIRLVVPFPPGGGTDAVSRLMADKLNIGLGWTVVIDNKPGAGGNIGLDAVAKAAPDGYTIGGGHLAPLAVNPTLVPKTVNYNVKTDLAPIVLVEEAPLILNVNKDQPIKNVQDLIAMAKKDPGAITFGSSGVGGAHHLSGELFAHQAGVEMSHVPYKGGAPAATDLMAGHISMMFEMGYAAMPAIEAGKVRPLAVTSAKRLALLPDVPTLAESGLPEVESDNWPGIVAPAGTPAEIIEKLNAATNRVLKKPEVIKAFDATGGQVGGGSPEDFAKFIDSETQKWAEVIKSANISVD